MKFTRSTITTVLASVLVIVVGAGWYFGLYSPLTAHIASTQAQVGVDQTQLANDRVQLAQLVDDKRSAALLRAQLEALTSALPTTFSLASFISQADATASKAGVPLLQITPSQPGAAPSTVTSSANVPGVSSVAFTAEATGTFVELMHFLHDLDHLGELLNISTIQLSAISGGASANPKIDLSFTGAVYYRS
ncbi:type 4a pilus biogenesis protein PilO [Ferrimicrobium sp.]|uniref:type 4a pilus biogenesis protein PilO n=1 Tax=Ferrimicrobium sp. TaxID=2926050 RepID=UPI0026053939|nr:type 4a pilus biogenesis protein PilO [Ferrimicrobium sp.]